MKTINLAAAVTLSLACFTEAQAHHSIAAVFNQEGNMSITGEVVEFEFVNPHAFLRLKVADDQGKEEIWEIEMAGRLNLTNGSFTPTTFQPGEHLTVSGFPPHVKSPNLFFQSATRADGTVVLPPGLERRDSLDEERRLRRLAREQGHTE